MVKHIARLILLVSVAIVCGGCGSSDSSGPRASMSELANAADAQRQAEQKKAAAQAEAERKAQAEAQETAEQEMKKAGRAQVGEGGYLTAIVGARRRILNETDRWPWVQAVQHFQAEHGRLPKDHDEFMNRIVIPLEINLGYKAENEEFFYDPNEGDFGELFVVEKAEAPTAK